MASNDASPRAARALAAVALLAWLPCWQAALAQAPAPGVAAPATAAQERAAHAEVCNNCHDANIVVGALRTPGEWDDVLVRMKANGAEATPLQFALIRAFLLRSYGHADVNAAPAADLAAVLDLAPEVAEAVVSYRNAHGAFKSLDEIKKIPGVDAEKVDARKDRIMGVL